MTVRLVPRFVSHAERMAPRLAAIRLGRLRAAHVADQAKIEYLSSLALTDSLTGLPNRRAFDDRLGKKIEEQRRGGSSFTLVICDIDYFKKVNDMLGHQAGDLVLAELARILQQSLRKSDEVFRIGGEEFAVLLAHPDPHKNPLIPLERLRTAVEAADFGIQRKVTISIGFASLSDSESGEQLIKNADRALYRAKAEGRNCIRAAEAA